MKTSKKEISAATIDFNKKSAPSFFRNKQLEKEIKKQAKKNHYNYYKEYLKKVTHYEQEGLFAAIKFYIKARISYRFNTFCSRFVYGDFKILEMKILRIEQSICDYERILKSNQVCKDTKKCIRIIDQLEKQKEMLETFM